MDNLFEIIVPIIFAAIYFFGHMFSGKSEEDASPDPPAKRGQEDPDIAERQRRIQEEIRRKIMERRGQVEESAPLERSSPEQQRPSQPEPEPQSQPEPHRQPQPEPQYTAQRRQREEAPDARFSWDQSDDAYDNKIQDRLKQIEATKRQAAKLSKQAKASRERVKSTTSSTTRPRGRSRIAGGPVRNTLRDPAAARVAFIYSEILGTPTSLKQSATVPGLRQ